MPAGSWMPSAGSDAYKNTDPYGATTGANQGLGSSWGDKFKSGLGGWQGALGGLAGGLLGGLFGGDSGPGADDFLSKIPDELKPYLEPYSKAGIGAMGDLQKQYGGLMSDPAGFMQHLGSQYQQSPGLHFAIQQALQGAGHSAALGGMAGSPAAQQQSQQLATNLGQQDYYNWLNKAMGVYGQGLSGEQNLANMGLEGGSQMAQAIGQALSAQAQAAQERQAAGAQSGGGIGGFLGDLAGAAMSAWL